MNAQWTRALALHVEPGDICDVLGSKYHVSDVKKIIRTHFNANEEVYEDTVMELELTHQTDSWDATRTITVTMNELTQVSVLRKPKESP